MGRELAAFVSGVWVTHQILGLPVQSDFHGRFRRSARLPVWMRCSHPGGRDAV
ncbi:Uncharacterised protein [Mycobacteroides abscessus subsp. abscessus]|nr:Uncharacterised protein [Mycobacteroides abscessus subsp. abscessus]